MFSLITMTDIDLISTANSSFEQELLTSIDSWKDKFVYFENRKYPVLHKKVNHQTLLLLERVTVLKLFLMFLNTEACTGVT